MDDHLSSQTSESDSQDMEEDFDDEDLEGEEDPGEEEGDLEEGEGDLGEGEEEVGGMDDGSDDETIKKTESNTKPGILYLSRIPTLMNVKKIRQIFSEFGELDRIFLQPDERKSARSKNTYFTEGWVEFSDKRVAKRVARALNNQKVGGKRKNKWYDELWNIKYLPKFQWTHLNERLAYERAVHKQRLRTEVSQVKREMTQFKSGVERKRIEERNKLRKKGKGGEESSEGAGSVGRGGKFTFKQRTDFQAKTKSSVKDKDSASSDTNFLKGLFSGGCS